MAEDLIKRFNRSPFANLERNARKSMIDRFNSNNKGESNNLKNYYKQYGYTAMIATVGGYLLGINTSTDVASSLLSSLVPGVSRNSVGAFLLNTGQTLLRNSFISNKLNSILPRPNVLNIPDSEIQLQTLPSEWFIALNPPAAAHKDSNIGDFAISTLKNAFLSSLKTTVRSISNTGTITLFDWERLFGKSMDAAEKILLAQTGIKYTKAVGWFDSSRPSWADSVSYITYDKYIAYGVDLNYSNIRIEYKDSIEDRYKKISEKSQIDFIQQTKESVSVSNSKNIILPNNLDGSIKEKIGNSNKANAQEYLAVTGEIPNSNTEPEKLYSNKEDIRNKINKLGFPQYNIFDSEFRGDSLLSTDKINMLDAGDNYEDEMEDYILFKIEDVTTKQESIPIIFRATVINISDNGQSEWDTTKYIGRPDDFSTYTGFTRTIGFNFSVYTNAARELETQWRKINRFMGFIYPVKYPGSVTMRAPIVRLTIGNLYSGLYGFFDNITMNPDENSMWDTTPGYQLPHIINFQVSFKVIYEYNSDNPSAPKSNMNHFNHHHEGNFDLLRLTKRELNG